MINTTFKTALLGSGAAVALLAGPAFAAEDNADLKAQIDALQNRLNQLETQSTTKAQKEQVAPAQAVTGGEFPGSWKLPGSDTSISFSGYVKADSFFTMNAPSTAIGDSFAVTAIPLKSSAANSQGGDFRMHSRQSRIRFDSRTPTDWGSLRTRIEGDFFGPAGNQRVSNSDSFRVRHAYGQLGPVLAGQTWSTFMDQDTFFDTVDFYGAAGQEFTRQTQIRYTASVMDALSADLAIENPEQNNAVTAGANAALTQNVNGVDRMPDFVAALRYRPSWGAVNVSGVARNFNYNSGNNFDDSTWGGGGHAGVTVKLWGKDTVAGVVNYGKGLGRYVNGSAEDYYVTGATPGAAPTNTSNTITPVSTLGGWGSFTHYWADNLRSNIIGGAQTMDIPVSKLGAAANGQTDQIVTAHVNLIWNPVSKVSIGLEYMMGWRQVAASHNTPNGAGNALAPGGNTAGTAQRLQLGMQYNF
ncbi:MAG: DcaP family trimeric outer membrane transporter [Alphaproteobacteria bacterium]